MNQLMSDNVVQVPKCPAGGKHDPAAEGLRNPASALADSPAYCVGLLELRCAGVEDQRLAAGQLVVEDARQPGVPPFRHPCCMDCGGFLRRIEVDVEVLGLEHPEVEALVLDFVSAEVLGVERGG